MFLKFLKFFKIYLKGYGRGKERGVENIKEVGLDDFFFLYKYFLMMAIYNVFDIRYFIFEYVGVRRVFVCVVVGCGFIGVKIFYN